MKIMLIWVSYLIVGCAFASVFRTTKEKNYGYDAFLMLCWPLCVVVLFLSMLAVIGRMIFNKEP